MQFTCEAFIARLSDQGIRMDGKGRCLDNSFFDSNGTIAVTGHLEIQRDVLSLGAVEFLSISCMGTVAWQVQRLAGRRS